MKYQTEREIHLKGKGLMKVKTAAHLLSRSMAKALATGYKRSVKSRGKLRFDPFRTAVVVKEFDELFDYCNGTANPKDRKFNSTRRDVKPDSPHLAIWRAMKEKFDNMEFHKRDKKTGKIKIQRPACQDGWILTLTNLEQLWRALQAKGFTQFCLRRVQQDSLENLFSVIRQHLGCNDNPTCGHFTAALKTSVITGLTSVKARRGNTEDDDGELRSNLNSRKVDRRPVATLAPQG